MTTRDVHYGVDKLGRELAEKTMWPFKSKIQRREAVARFYYTDPDVGLSRETSHPNFVKLATDDFYYDCCDDFSPFGSDDGADALAMLEEWFKKGGRPHGVIRFLRETVTSWGLGAPQNLMAKTEKGMDTWLRKADIHENYLASECRLRIAVAFGQLKISGKIDSPIFNEAKLGIRWLAFLNTRLAQESSDWEYAGLEAQRIELMETVLYEYKTQQAGQPKQVS